MLKQIFVNMSGAAFAAAALGVIVGAALVIYGSISSGVSIPSAPPDPGLTEQHQSLELVEDNLKNLLEFVENQKLTIEIEQETIHRLEEEKTQLQSIVDIDRGVVEEIAQILERRDSRVDWGTIGIGFGSGILASEIASLIIAAVRPRRG